MNKLNKNSLQKKLFYRSKNRGCKEMDYILGNFANLYLPFMEEKKLLSYSLILDQNDNDLYNWITNKSPAPSNLDTEIIRELRNIVPYTFYK
ncbi:MAG: succinate dehydrogenase assembly factor 2 [Rickettsia endosymbiont of Pentastiridius leporinus]